MSIAAASDPTAPAQPWLVLKFGGTSVSKRERWDTIGRLAQELSLIHISEPTRPH